MSRRVVVTGMGILTPVGIGRESFWRSVCEGRSGIAPITRFDCSAYPTRIAGEVQGFEPLDYMDRKEARRLDRFTQFAIAATRMAIRDAALNLDAEDKDRVGVLIGSGIGGMETFETQYRLLVERGPERVSPFFVPMMIANMAAGHVAIDLGVSGPNTCVVTACASASHALGDAYKLIQRGAAEVMLAGGTEASITPLSLAGFCAARALSTRNDDPQAASRPFDQDRDGFVMGEGAGVLVLEDLEHARARNADILAEITGYGMNADAYHITQPAPDGKGSARCMQLALEDAGLKPEEIDYINAHGTSTDLNDRIETKAIKDIFRDHAHKVPISSTKSMTGHLLGAGGAVELAVCILAMNHQLIPPTINYEHPDPECDLDYVPNTARPAKVQTCLSNSFGFGGHNACLVVRSFNDPLGG
ncbi:MAG: beta-ketoacyl-ACP synthase II [Firmicutes bacterium]|nr:beta-ketoacyl-ACP synthase II [Bacillota bacterium]